MNDLVQSNLSNQITNLTPIEIALGIDEEGRTTARKLYTFLELNPSNYSKWAKRNIESNEFAEKNIDFIAFVLNDECGGQATTDYKLSASFAKKLAMGTHNTKGEIAKNYFVKIEDKLKEIAIQSQTPKQLSPMDQLRLQYSVLEEQDQKIKLVDERVFNLENTMTIDYSQQEELRTLATRKVVAILGGKDTPAYKELNKKAFSSMWKDYKRIVDVNSYKNTAVKDLLFARQVIIDWKPNRELELMIKGANIGGRC
ncbi:UNVERIFIED_ORG: hypothetical protein B2H93_05035 [Clostridium botulinum]|nr:ORF6C domain-containing protein [Clostridium botulinum]